MIDLDYLEKGSLAGLVLYVEKKEAWEKGDPVRAITLKDLTAELRESRSAEDALNTELTGCRRQLKSAEAELRRINGAGDDSHD